MPHKALRCLHITPTMLEDAIERAMAAITRLTGHGDDAEADLLDNLAVIRDVAGLCHALHADLHFLQDDSPATAHALAEPVCPACVIGSGIHACGKDWN